MTIEQRSPILTCVGMIIRAEHYQFEYFKKIKKHIVLHTHCTVVCLVAQWCPTLCDPMDCSPPGSSVHGDSPGKNTRVGCHTLLQGIFPTQESDPGIWHCRRILYFLSHQRSPLSDLLEFKLDIKDEHIQRRKIMEMRREIH